MSNINTNSIKENTPFNLYDFFGYIFPGLYICGMSVLLIFYIKAEIIYDLINGCLSLVGKNEFLFGLIFFIGGLASVYITGHFVATISHLMIDRLLINRILNYPLFKYLSILPEEDKWTDLRKKGINKLVILLFIIILFLPLASGNCIRYIIISLIILLFIIIIFKGLSFILNSRESNDYLNEALKESRKKAKYLIYFFKLLKKARTVSKRIIQNLFSNKMVIYLLTLIPEKIVGVLIHFLEDLSQINKGFKDDTILTFKRNFKRKFKLDSTTCGTEVYWLTFYYILKKSPIHASYIMNWLYLYSFARNICAAAFSSSFILIFIKLLGYHDRLNYFNIFLLINNIIGIVFLIRYLVLYYNYYSKSIVRIFILLSEDEKILINRSNQ